MRWLKNLLLLFLVLAGLVGIVASLGQYYFENEVKQYVKSSLNEILAAPIDVEEINFSLLQKFPNASISFEEALAWDAFPNQKGKDTLLYASRIFLEFNVLDIINKNYVLREIEISGADIRLKWNKKGEPNYIIWKESAETKNPLKMNLEKVTFKDSKLLIDHMKSAFISSYDVKEMTLKGTITDQILDLQCQANLSRFGHITDDFIYSSDQELLVSTHFYLDMDEKKIQLSESSVDWNGLQSKAKGTLDYGKNDYHFSFTGVDQSLKSIMRVLPQSITDPLKEYSLSSQVDYSVETGNAGQDDWKSIIEFTARDGKITHMPSAVSAKNLSYAGVISNYQGNTSIRVDAFSGIFSGGNFKGRFSMLNLNHPQITAALQGTFELSELIPFINNTNISNAVGSLVADLQFKGSFYNLKNIQKKEIERAITTGSITFEKLGFDIDSLNLSLRDLAGRFDLNDNDAEIHSLTGVWMGSHFDISGEIINFMPYLLLDNQPLNIAAKGVFDRIDLESFLSSEDNTKQQTFQIPSYLRMEIDAKIGEISYKKFSAKEVVGHFVIQNSSLLSDNFEFQTAGGKVNSYLSLHSHENGDLKLEVQGRLMNMEISSLFYELDNMGQDIITDKNLKGQLNADIHFKGRWDKTLDLDLSSINVLANVKVDNGELNDLKSLEQIGEYLKGNAIASAFIDTKGLSKKLKNIRFDQLENQIEIRNQVIYIPEMQVLSDAVDINLSGTHSFSNKIDYSMNFRLREIMKQVKETEFGVIEDDGLGSRIFIRMTGTASNPIFSLDKEAKKAYKKDTWSEEKENINTLLKEEFSTLFGGEKQEDKATAPKKYTIEWDVDPDSTGQGNKSTSDSLKNNKKGKTLIFQTDEDIRDSDDDDY
jgi:hypothetical protein